MNILKFERSTNPEDKIYGKVLIEKSEKMRLWFLVFKNEKGGYYVKPPSIKINNDWTNSFELSDLPTQKKLCQEVLKLLVDGKFIEL